MAPLSAVIGTIFDVVAPILSIAGAVVKLVEFFG